MVLFELHLYGLNTIESNTYIMPQLKYKIKILRYNTDEGINQKIWLCPNIVINKSYIKFFHLHKMQDKLGKYWFSKNLPTLNQLYCSCFIKHQIFVSYSTSFRITIICKTPFKQNTFSFCYLVPK